MIVNYTTILDHMVATAREAGALTLDHFRRFRDIEIGVKGPGDFVSDADRDSETLIRERLLGQYPWGLTGEEFAPVEGADQDHRWLVDPIDGTTNFLNGQHYTITIALRRGNQTLELYYGQRKRNTPEQMLNPLYQNRNSTQSGSLHTGAGA